MIKKSIKNVIKKLGYQLFRRFYYDFDSDESIRKILSIANILPKDILVFDVGANVGQSVDRFRKYLPDAVIYSFEPSPSTFSILRIKKVLDKNLHCFNFGLGAYERVATFFNNPDSGSNSFYKLNIESAAFKLGATTLALKNQNKTTPKHSIDFNSAIKCDIKTINSICAELNITHIEVLKIDTQGFESEVLKGASKILKNVLIVEAEVMFAGTYEKSSSFSDIETTLQEYGFVLWEIPYIGKFATNSFNRINFVDIQFVNVELLRKKLSLDNKWMI